MRHYLTLFVFLLSSCSPSPLVSPAITLPPTATIVSTVTPTETPTFTETPSPTLTPTETLTPEPKPAEIILTDPTKLFDEIVKRTSDCLFAPWKKAKDPSEFTEYKQLVNILREKDISYEGTFITGGNYPEPVCFIAGKGYSNVPLNRTYWYLTKDGELDTFHIIVKKP